MIFAFMAFGFAATIVTLLAMLIGIARASRSDALFLPAGDRNTRMARRLTGMYVRDYQREQDDERYAGRDGALVGR